MVRECTLAAVQKRNVLFAAYDEREDYIGSRSSCILISGQIGMANDKTLPLIKAGILAPVLDWLESAGANVERHLDNARIPGELVASGGWIAKRQGYNFLSEVVDYHRCEELGFAAYSGLRLEDLGPVWAAMHSSVTFNEALNVFCRMAGRVYQGNEFWISTGGSHAWLCGRVTSRLGDVHPCTRHLGLMVLLKVVQAAAGPLWSPHRICLQAPETIALRSTSGLESCEVSFEQSHTAIAFPKNLLSRPMPKRPRSDLSKRDSGQRDDELLSKDDSFGVSLGRLLTSRLRRPGLPKLDQAAEIVGVSQRTIRRRLNDEGTSYRGIIDRIRFTNACEMLRNSDASVTEIAFRLGYSGPNNFVRSFKRISCVTPSEFRRHSSYGCETDR